MKLVLILLLGILPVTVSAETPTSAEIL